MFITPDFSVSFKGEISLDSLLEKINNRLSEISQMVYESVTYGIKHEHCLQDFDDLLSYRDIIIQKVNGCRCFSNISMKQLISKIKHLTNK